MIQYINKVVRNKTLVIILLCRIKELKKQAILKILFILIYACIFEKKVTALFFEISILVLIKII